MPTAPLYERNRQLQPRDISQRISSIENDSTPFTAMLSKPSAPPENMLLEYPVEAYPDRPVAGVIDGHDVNEFNSVAREKLQTRGQIFRESYQVTTLANMLPDAGVGRNELGHQRMLAGKLLRFQLEKALLSDQENQVDTGTVPNLLRGVYKWMSTSAQTIYPVPADFRPSSTQVYTGTVAALTESEFVTRIKACFDQRRAPVDLDGFVGSDLKAQIDTFTVADATSGAIRRYNFDGKNASVTRMVDFIKSSFGEVRVHLNTYLLYTMSTGAASSYSPKSGVFLDLSKWELRTLQKPTLFDLEDQGGGPRGFMQTIVALACKNPLAQFVVNTATAS